MIGRGYESYAKYESAKEYLICTQNLFTRIYQNELTENG